MIIKIAFLLGSGISIPAGFPKTCDITSCVLSGERVMHHTDGTYYFTEGNPADKPKFDIYVQRVVSLFKILLDKNHYKNYEDLYYVVNQILGNELGEYENPIVGAFVEKISTDIERIKWNNTSETSEPWDLITLFQEAENYIRDIVWRMLQKNAIQLEYLKSVCDACLDDEFKSVDIFTLNHDSILENALDKSGVTYNLGFGKPINGVRYWRPTLLERRDIKVRLLKLHGSIDWFSFPPNKYSFGTPAIGIPSDLDDIWHTQNPSGELQTPYGGRPVFLVGTFNKILRYTSEIFADLQCLFRRSLRTIDHLVVCGYGFGDKGINSQIIEWMFQSTNKRLTIIHKEPENLQRNARFAIEKNWNSWLDQGRLSNIKANIENISWREIKENLKLFNLNCS